MKLGQRKRCVEDCKIRTLQLLTGLTQDKDLNNLGNAQKADESLQFFHFLCVCSLEHYKVATRSL